MPGTSRTEDSSTICLTSTPLASKLGHDRTTRNINWGMWGVCGELPGSPEITVGCDRRDEPGTPSVPAWLDPGSFADTNSLPTPDFSDPDVVKFTTKAPMSSCRVLAVDRQKMGWCASTRTAARKCSMSRELTASPIPCSGNGPHRVCSASPWRMPARQLFRLVYRDVLPWYSTRGTGFVQPEYPGWTKPLLVGERPGPTSCYSNLVIPGTGIS